MGAVMDLFADDDVAQTEEQVHVQADPVVRAIRAIERVLFAGKALAISFSSGKDSSCVANLAFTAAINVKRLTGSCPNIYVLNADTGVESPVVRALADAELARMRAFAERHGLPIKTHVSRPTLSSSWALRILGCRALPSFPGANSDCTVEWKIDPMSRLRARINAAENGKVVTLIGTRSAESARRAIATAERKETAHTTWFGPSGDERLSPILDFSTDNVFEYLGECAAGMHDAYSDFADLMAFYADAGASSCVIVADMKSAANSKPCGARGGCWTCVQVSNDRSVENMISQDPDKYRYLVPLLNLRNYIADTQWDYSLRNYVGRTIDDDGFMIVKPDQYSPEMAKSLLRYALTAQLEANELGAPSRVQPIGVRELIGIDFYWSLRAITPPFTALSIYFDIEDGARYHPPKLSTPVRPSPCVEVGRIYVGTGWDEDAHPMRPTGLRDDVWESFHDSCGPELRTGTSGQSFLRLEESPEFDVDEQGAWDFLEFEARRKIEQYRDWPYDWTAGAMEYLKYGTVSPAKGMSSKIDDIMRRAQWIQRHRLHGQLDPQELRARCHSLSAHQPELF